MTYFGTKLPRNSNKQADNIKKASERAKIQRLKDYGYRVLELKQVKERLLNR